MNIHKIFIILIVATIFCSCSKEDDITAELDPAKFEVKDSDNPLEHYIYEYYTKYNSFILFEYKDSDYKWNMTHNSDYVVTLPKKELFNDGLEYAKKVFLEVYPEDFIAKYFPYKLLMAENITNFDYNTGMDVEMMAASGMSCIAIGGIKDGVADYTDEQIIDAKAQINGKFWSDYMVNNNIIKIPDSFYNISKDYYDHYVINASGEMNPDAKKEDFGCIYSFDFYGYEKLPSIEKDLCTFFEYMFSHNSTEIQEISEKHPLVKQKFEILINLVKNSCDIDLSKINN